MSTVVISLFFDCVRWQIAYDFARMAKNKTIPQASDPPSARPKPRWKKKETTQLTTRVGGELVNDLDALCEKEHYTQAEVLRYLMGFGMAAIKEKGSHEIGRMRSAYFEHYGSSESDR